MLTRESLIEAAAHLPAEFSVEELFEYFKKNGQPAVEKSRPKPSAAEVVSPAKKVKSSKLRAKKAKTLLVVKAEGTPFEYSGGDKVEAGKAILALGGAWADWSDEEFDKYMDEVARVRASLFTRQFDF